tara:strand:- start:3156 stop:3512 length:357 start_codon:yes stop_codon:yes gene_type:complete
MDRMKQFKTVQEEALDLFSKKNADYGDAFANFGPVGVIVRMGDKINRLSNVTKSNITLIKTETVRDTLIDLHNYAAMAIMLMDENTNKDIIWSVSDDSGPSGDEGPSSIKNLLDKLAD